MENKKRIIAPVTSRNVNKHFCDKRITKRVPPEPGQVKGNIVSVDALIYWFQKAHYAFYSHTYNVIYQTGDIKTCTSLAELQLFLEQNIVIKSGPKKGQLPISIVRAIYNSGVKDSHRDVARDTFLSVQGFEDYLPCPSVDGDGNFIPASKRDNVYNVQKYIKKTQY